jgi:glycosyltransferase involved in cell wall biosynthesis
MADGNVNVESLRVAIVSTSALSTPPKTYGGTELVIAELARELGELGHRPIVFATGDSTCLGAQRALFERAVWPPNPWAELRHSSAAWGRIARDDVDVVHVHHAGALPFTTLFPFPTVATIHHDRDESVLPHYLAYDNVDFVAISRRQAELSSEIPFAATVHHGLPCDRYPFGEGGEHCAFLGRFAPSKAPHLAIDAARQADLPLVLAGEVHGCDRGYFDREVAGRLSDRARWIGAAGHDEKVALLQRSRCLVFPIQWEEPFGLVMIEAMLIGTPVVAFARGAAPEVVEHGVTGFLVDSFEEMCARLRDVGALDRHACRARARERWDVSRMAREYAAVYRRAIERRKGRRVELGSLETSR